VGSADANDLLFSLLLVHTLRIPKLGCTSCVGRWITHFVPGLPRLPHLSHGEWIFCHPCVGVLIVAIVYTMYLPYSVYICRTRTRSGWGHCVDIYRSCLICRTTNHDTEFLYFDHGKRPLRWAWEKIDGLLRTRPSVSLLFYSRDLDSHPLAT
jgi:hypothetical protein